MRFTIDTGGTFFLYCAHTETTTIRTIEVARAVLRHLATPAAKAAFTASGVE
ncbi:MAG: hypothetical protein Q8O11_10685 [Syntrophales bacterium]|nr:hypothetical protein [Syntrophales bacterium]